MRSYQKRHREAGWPRWIGFCKLLRFEAIEVTLHMLSGRLFQEHSRPNKSTRRVQTSATGTQFLDFQNLPLALILLSPPPPVFHILAIVIRITPNLFFMDPGSDPCHSQNLIPCFLSHLGHILKILSKSVYNFLSYLSLKITFHGSRRSR